MYGTKALKVTLEVIAEHHPENRSSYICLVNDDDAKVFWPSLGGLAGERQSAERNLKRLLIDLERCARRLAVIDLLEREAAAEAAEARLQRNAKAAFTRAHNKDPWGFNAIAVKSADNG